MVIGLVGRTNVGKSTLFNRLAGSFRAIVTDVAGTTRELLREEVEVVGRPCVMVDSPGLDDFELEKGFIQQIIDDADMLIFVVNGKHEIGEQELQIRKMILEAGKKEQTLLVVNKLDGKVYDADIDMYLADWYALGWPTVLPLSAQQEQGLVDLEQSLEYVAKKNKIDRNLPVEQEDVQKNLKMAIVGRPNVGKSTLLNTLVGEDISWVQDKPGTTLDYVTASFLWQGEEVDLYDTAGIRKKGKTVGLEKIAYEKTKKMLERYKPVTVMLLDLEEGLTHRDKSLIGELVEAGLPMVIAVNKIDSMSPRDADMKIQHIVNNLGFVWIPLVKISAKDGIGLPKLMQEVQSVAASYATRVPTPALNKAFKKAWVTSPPRFPKNKICKCKYISQVAEAPPVFKLSVNNENYANFAYTRWVEKLIRKNFGFTGVPINIEYSSKHVDNPYVDA